jgi:S1-C subfamily serine protease
MLLPQGAVLSERAQVELIAEDPPTGLTLVRTIQARAPVRDDSWIRHEVPSPRFLMRSDPYSAISLRPFYAAALSESNAPLWSTALWQLPQGTDVKPGSFVFTGDGEWVGLTVAHDAGTAVVPADALVSFSRRLLERSNGPRGTLGIEVQPLMPALRTLTGARSGVVVTYVAPPASIDGVKIADVLESADGRPLPTIEHWQRFLADLEVDVPVVIHLRRAHAETDVTLVPKAQTAALEMASLPSPVKPKPPAHAVRPLGLELRTIARAGAEVVTVQPASLGAIAGLRVGDVITMVGALPRPTAAQVQRAARAAESQPLLLAVQRGDSHRLVALEP